MLIHSIHYSCDQSVLRSSSYIFDNAPAWHVIHIFFCWAVNYSGTVMENSAYICSVYNQWLRCLLSNSTLQTSEDIFFSPVFGPWDVVCDQFHKDGVNQIRKKSPRYDGWSIHISWFGVITEQAQRSIWKTGTGRYLATQKGRVHYRTGIAGRREIKERDTVTIEVAKQATEESVNAVLQCENAWHWQLNSSVASIYVEFRCCAQARNITVIGAKAISTNDEINIIVLVGQHPHADLPAHSHSLQPHQIGKPNLWDAILNYLLWLLPIVIIFIFLFGYNNNLKEWGVWGSLLDQYYLIVFPLCRVLSTDPFHFARLLDWIGEARMEPIIYSMLTKEGLVGFIWAYFQTFKVGTS